MQLRSPPMNVSSFRCLPTKARHKLLIPPASSNSLPIRSRPPNDKRRPGMVPPTRELRVLDHSANPFTHRRCRLTILVTDVVGMGCHNKGLAASHRTALAAAPVVGVIEKARIAIASVFKLNRTHSRDLLCCPVAGTRWPKPEGLGPQQRQ